MEGRKEGLVRKKGWRKEIRKERRKREMRQHKLRFCCSFWKALPVPGKPTGIASETSRASPAAGFPSRNHLSALRDVFQEAGTEECGQTGKVWFLGPPMGKGLLRAWMLCLIYT